MNIKKEMRFDYWLNLRDNTEANKCKNKLLNYQDL